MSGERPRDITFGVPPGSATTPEGDRISQSVRTSDTGGESDGASRPLVPRPSSRKPISGPQASPAPSPHISALHGNVIPPPAPLPRVPGLDALMTASAEAHARAQQSAPVSNPSSTRRRSRRPVNPAEDSEAAKPSASDSASSEEETYLSVPPDAFDESLDPFLGDDSVLGAFAAEPSAKGFVALAPPLGSPFLPSASAPAPAPRSGPAAALRSVPVTPPRSGPAAPSSVPRGPAPSQPAEDDGVIRPMRIITIGSNADTVEVSRRTSSLPPPDLSSRPSSSPALEPGPPPRAGSSPSISTEADEVEIDALDVEDEPVTQPSQVIAAAGRIEARDEDIEEEVEADRITVVDPIEPLPSFPASSEAKPKKPPPPPPKRVSGDPGPNSRPSPDTTSLSGTPAVSVPPDRPSSPDAMRKRQKAWWDELFGDDFTRTMDHFDAKAIRKECDFIEDRLGLEKGAVMLDLACGPGAHAVELASRGYSVVGYDLSLAMLARAADEAQERGQKLNFLHGDMREMAFEETFDGVYCWSMSFGYFDDEKNLNVLSRIRRALRKGGMLLLDVSNRDYVAPRQPSLVWFEGDGCVCMDEMHVDFFASRLRVKRTVMFEDGRSKEVDYSIRLYTLHELGKMLHECGFKVVEVTGHPAHPGVFFGSESPRIIILAERD